MNTSRLYLCVFLLLAAFTARAQPPEPSSPAPTTTLSGFVSEADGDQESVPGATVFLSGTQKGTVTDAEGFFTLTGIAPGHYDVIVTMPGYRLASVPVDLEAGEALTLRVGLSPEDRRLPGLVVYDDGAAWRRNLARFTDAFFGSTPISKQCRLINADVLRFGREGNVLRARAQEPLQIENRALGYRVTYALEDFEQRPSSGLVRWRGGVHFEELPPRDSQEAQTWRMQRREAYRGSFRHFLRALAKGNTRDEGFRLYMTDSTGLALDLLGRIVQEEVSPAEIVTRDRDDRFVLDYEGRYLQVRYLPEPISVHYLIAQDFVQDETQFDLMPPFRRQRLDGGAQRSMVRLLEPYASFDSFGRMIDPYAVTKYGYWSWEDRVSNMLPFEYEDEDEDES